MKFSHALLLASSLAFFACGGDDDDSPAAPSKDNGGSTVDEGGKTGLKSYDCSVKGGVKVVYPTGGEKFKVGDEITVVYGTDVDGSGYRFVFKVDEEDIGMDLFEESMGLEGKGDGKTCYEQKVKLSKDVVEATSTAIIRVIPYEDSKKGANSGKFKVSE